MKTLTSLMQSQFNDGFYTQEELHSLGFKEIGKHVLISKLARIYGASKISIGNYVRIDDFVILSGKITIGSFIHIGAFSIIAGSDIGVIIKDFCGISNHVKILSTSDDYSGDTMVNPCIPPHYKNIQQAQIIIQKHCIIGSGSTILPGAYLAEGVAVGTMSLITRNTNSWGIYFGIPAKRIKERKKNLLTLEQDLINHIQAGGGGFNYLAQKIIYSKKIA